MSDREALIRAICLHPDEDTPRLAYADWLDEHGDEGDVLVAEQIRVQIEFDEVLGCGLPWRHPVIWSIAGETRRGFVWRIELPMQLYLDQVYLDHAVELFRRHPVTSVLINDKRPEVISRQAHAWTFCDMTRFAHHLPQVLPDSFLDPMARHPLRTSSLNSHRSCIFGTACEALLAASEVAVNIARHLNELPPLPLTARLNRPRA